MALGAKVVVNSTTIGYIDCHRVVTGEGTHTYSYEYLVEKPRQPGDARRLSLVTQGFLDHDKEDGALVLLQRALERINAHTR